jgi:Acetoacetate decarboxylase (ADC)
VTGFGSLFAQGDASGHGNAKGLYSSEVAIRPGRSNSATIWHYAGDAVGVEFWTDADATAAILPSGLSRDPKPNGHAVMMFLDWQFTAQDDEYLDPARYQHREAFILVDALYCDVPVMWCPYIYVDNDAALARGWTRGFPGFPKKMGSIFQTRSYAASGPAAAPVASGSRFGASLSAHG